VSDVEELSGKVVVITGAAKGLGRAYATEFAAAGAKVVANDVDADAVAELGAEIERRGGEAAVHVGDIAAAGIAAELIAAATAGFGRVDGLVNNAGIRPEGSAWEEDPDRVRTTVEVNLLGSILCGIAALGVMREQGSGSVVNVSSRAQSGIPASATYAATKGGLASLTYSWAIDMLPHGVRVNAVAPQAGGTGTRRAGQPVEGEPLPEDMAPLVAYLLCERSARVTGQVIRMGSSRPGSLDLALMSPPRTSVSYGSDAGWSVDALAEFFDSRLGAELEPVGANPIDVAYTVARGTPLRIEEATGL
jgi:NAD(P)-dependent dehydrogenase (short-subunit alcohol dehydrogenase family)